MVSLDLHVTCVRDFFSKIENSYEINSLAVIGCLASNSNQYVCQNGGKCFNINGIGNCACPGGFTGLYCHIPLGCNSGGNFSCINGGTCVTFAGICICPPGYTGFTCSLSIFCK
jgi:hypothetical protein